MPCKQKTSVFCGTPELHRWHPITLLGNPHEGRVLDFIGGSLRPRQCYLLGSPVPTIACCWIVRLQAAPPFGRTYRPAYCEALRRLLTASVVTSHYAIGVSHSTHGQTGCEPLPCQTRTVSHAPKGLGVLSCPNCGTR